MNSNEMFINFMYYFCNFPTRNGDHLILLIKTGNAHEERILPQTIINVFKKCLGGGIETQKNDDGGQVVVAFTMTEINYLALSLFCDLVWSLSDLYLWH